MIWMIFGGGFGDEINFVLLWCGCIFGGMWIDG